MFLSIRIAYGLTVLAGLLCSPSQVLAQELPWHLGSLNQAASAPAAINTASIKPGPHAVAVAVIDSGVLVDHPSLSGRLLAGYDMLSGTRNLRGGRSPDARPDAPDVACSQANGGGESYRTHGTEVASLIAGNGAEGVVGVNPRAHIVPVRLFGGCGMSRADLMDALAWSAGFSVKGVPDNPNPAKVINLSFAGGGAVCGAEMQQLIHKIVKKNIFVVAAVGNHYQKKMAEPANCEGVISVGAVDAENNIAAYSALDARTVVYAPGGGASSFGFASWRVNKLKVATLNTGLGGAEQAVGEFRGVGTSYAAPVVSGFISLLLSHRPDWTPADFKQNLASLTRAVNPSDKCPDCAPRGLALGAASMAWFAQPSAQLLALSAPPSSGARH